MKTFIEQSESQTRAGGIPFFRDGKTTYVCLFVSNNAYYGGAAPQIPKGRVDPGENVKIAAAREASEETGISFSVLKNSKSFVIFDDYFFSSSMGKYKMEVYAIQVDKMHKVKTNDEGVGVWLPLEKALKSIRKDQLKILQNMNKVVDKL